VPISEDVDLVKIANSHLLEGFSGADLSALTREAQVNALHLRIEFGSTTDKVTVSHEDFNVALTKVFPSVSQKDE